MPDNFWQNDPVAKPPASASPAGAPGEWWHGDPIASPSPSHGMAADVAMSAGTGMVKGVTGLAGMGGDLAELAKRGADKLSDYLPSIPSPAPDSTLGRLAKFL